MDNTVSPILISPILIDIFDITGIYFINFFKDPIYKKIYYTTSDKNKNELTINRCEIDGTNNEIIMSDGLSLIEGMTLDYKNQILYWIDSELIHIEMTSLNCECNLPGCRTEYCRKILIELDVQDKPRAITVGGGYIFWTDWSDNNPRIARADQDGTGIFIVVQVGIGTIQNIIYAIVLGESPSCFGIKNAS
jgi:hypothetical protein